MDSDWNLELEVVRYWGLGGGYFGGAGRLERQLPGPSLKWSYLDLEAATACSRARDGGWGVPSPPLELELTGY